mgnify:FL=1
MKKFRFSLETVLSYKQQVLEALQGEHAALLARVREQEAFLQSIWDEYHDYNDEFCERKMTGLPITDAIIYQNGLRVLEKRIQHETERLEQFRRQEEQKRAQVIEARKDTASLEKLRDKKLTAYEKELSRAEEQLIEEFVSNTSSARGA